MAEKKNIGVVIGGAGNIGKSIIRTLQNRKGIRIVAVVDSYPPLIGKDAGEVAGIDKIGIPITDSLETAFALPEADVAISVTKPCTDREMYETVKSAIDHGLNVLVPNMATCNLWFSNPELAKEIDEHCKEKGVSYAAIGSTQVLERQIISMTEGNTEVKCIRFARFADVHAFPIEGCRVEFGLSLTEEEFWKGVEDGSINDQSSLGNDIAYIAGHLGWKIDKQTYEQTPIMAEDDTVKGVEYTCQGYSEGVLRLETKWTFILDEERRYFDRITIDGASSADIVLTYSPDRGVLSTSGSLVNAIPAIIKVAPGYISTLDLPICSYCADEVHLHI